MQLSQAFTFLMSPSVSDEPVVFLTILVDGIAGYKKMRPTSRMSYDHYTTLEELKQMQNSCWSSAPILCCYLRRDCIIFEESILPKLWEMTEAAAKIWKIN